MGQVRTTAILLGILVTPLLISLLCVICRCFGGETITRTGLLGRLHFQLSPQLLVTRAELIDQYPDQPTSQQWSSAPQLDIRVFPELQGALRRMQSTFFEVWQGTYPSAIDWTAAVVNGLVSGTLHSISRSSRYSVHVRSDEGRFPKENGRLCGNQQIEDTVNAYFSQNIAYYFGEDAFSLRFQAHDDMLWVVLGWLETIRFINQHNRLHHELMKPEYNPHSGISQTAWFGKQFESTFAHRANVFYSIVHKAWDTSLCGGGLTWNPALATYKNTITNTQYIAASVTMYLYHPGDTNSSPFLNAVDRNVYHALDESFLEHAKRHDSKYLDAAIEAYDWLKAVNMTNEHGLYVDGYHINKKKLPFDSDRHNSTTDECNDRNEMVYTYNQGVLLSGLRGLWEATGEFQYLKDGHVLIRNVVAATGWNMPAFLARSDPVRPSSIIQEQDDDSLPHPIPNNLLGHDGILEEACDPSGACSQDSQTFKGIFFHHFTRFCSPLPTDRSQVNNVSHVAGPRDALLHRNSCLEYAHWVAGNTRAALKTKDEKQGIFGSWWGASINYSSDSLASRSERPSNPKAEDIPTQQVYDKRGPSEQAAFAESGDYSHFPSGRVYQTQLPDGAIDYRNMPLTELLQKDPTRWKKDSPSATDAPEGLAQTKASFQAYEAPQYPKDPNDRGRGRTLETQSGGVALLKALWEVLQLKERN